MSTQTFSRDLLQIYLTLVLGRPGVKMFLSNHRRGEMHILARTSMILMHVSMTRRVFERLCLVTDECFDGTVLCERGNRALVTVL